MWIGLGFSVALMFNVPFIGNVDPKAFLDPRRLLDVRKLWRSHQAHAADTLATPWRNASRLALENQFVFAELPRLSPSYGAIRLTTDPRDLHVEVDVDSGLVKTAPEMGEVSLGAATQWPMGAYGGLVMSRRFQQSWDEKSITNLNSLGASAKPADQTTANVGVGGVHIPIMSLPAPVSKILGPGGPSISVNGSENIRISGTSNWTNQQVGPLGQKPSLFPSLDMQQDLDIRIEGQLSDRIRLNMLQNSANQIPLSNRIAINYRGEEDALFQQIDLGNTNLTLPGTQYVSYSGKNEGLFGMKATSRLGPLDFTLLASKQEGRSERASYGGGASKQSITIRDLEYVKGTYYLLNDPAEGPYDISDGSLHVYVDDNIASNDVGETTRGVALPDPGEIAAVTSSNPADSVALAAQVGGGMLSVRGTFDLKQFGSDKDYEILGDIYGTGFKILRLNVPLLSSQRLAVTFDRQRMLPGNVLGPIEHVGGQDVTDRDGATRRVMKLLRVPPDLIGPASPSLDAPFDSTKALFRLTELEMHNFYNLGGQSIDPKTFKMQVRKGRQEPPKTTATLPKGILPYIEILGLDNMDELKNPPLQHAHDHEVDGTALQTGGTPLKQFVDFENGVLFFPDLRPFAPRLRGERGPVPFDFDRAVSSLLFRGDSLVGAVDSENEPNPGIYTHYTIQGDVDARYYIDVQYTAARATGEVSLGRGQLLEGSEVVTINGQALQRGRDYDIDYDLGRLTLKRQLGATDNLNVDYSYAPLFQQAGRTLVGSAFSLQGRDKSFGGAFMYESRGAQDIRPRLGEEPARSLIGDLNTAWTFRPQWMTRMVDLLPGVRTTVGSEFRFEAEAGASYPNPNTRNEVYIDDMEGVRDAVSLTMDQGHWHLSSVPSRKVNNFDRPMLDLPGHHYAELHWYSPYAAVKEGDLKPTLTDAQGKQNSHQSLALSIPRRPFTAESTATAIDTLWTGLTYSLDPAGIDLSRSQFIELWVNDFNDYHQGTSSFQTPRVRGKHVRLHIDLGKVSEDQLFSPDTVSNHRLDTEDQNIDGQLQVSGGYAEDTGLDGLDDDAEHTGIPLKTLPDGRKFYRDLVTSTAEDPQGDDFQTPSDDFKEEIDARRYLRTNGTEGNKNVYPYPETEDYNGNSNLDDTESYFEYTIDLGDDQSPYLLTDLQALKAAGQPGYEGVALDNGWRRYRIPIDDAARVKFGVPNLNIAQHVRLWAEGMILPDAPPDSTSIGGKHVERPLVMLGSLDIVGSRWRAVALDTVEVKAGATMTLNSVNTVDNADIYYAPFDPGETRNGNQALSRREQAISLEFEDLRGQKTLEAYKTFSIDENYSRYGKLDFWVTGYGVEPGVLPNDDLYYFVRFASDEQNQNYYEYRAPVPIAATGLDWREVGLEITELSNLKINPGYPRDSTGLETLLIRRARSPGSADSVIVVGRPSFTRLRRVSFGLLNLSTDTTATFPKGQLWFNELRSTDVAKDPGHAERLLVGGRLANLLQYNLAWNSRDEDFISVGETRGSGTATSNMSFSTGIDLHRFFEPTGIVLPLTFGYNEAEQRPRYSAGDDIVRSGRDLILSRTLSDNRTWGISYSRNWSDRSNPLLLYTLGGVTANYNTSNSHSLTPTGSDQSSTSSGAVNYNVAPRSLLGIALPLTRAKLFPLPERFYTNYRFDRRDAFSSDRPLGSEILVPRTPVHGNSGIITLGADIRPLDFYHYHADATRNLNVSAPPGGSLLRGRFYMGRNVSWGQTNDLAWAPLFLPVLRPQMSWSSRFAQNNGPELSQDMSVRAILNSQQVTMRWELPFGNLTQPPPVRRAGFSTDTTHRSRPKSTHPAIWRDLLSRLGSVSGELSATRGSGYSRVYGTPDFLYLFGLSSNPGLGDADTPPKVYAAPGNQGATNNGWRANARTNLRLPVNVQLRTTGEYESRFVNTNGADRGQTQLTFPDLTVDYGDVPKQLRMDKLIRNPQLRTAMSRQVTNEYALGRGTQTGITKQLQFRPLLSLSGELKNGMRVEFGTEHRHTDRALLQLGSSIAQDINTNVNLNLTRTYAQGQKFKFLGRESTVKSSVSIGLSSQYERQKGQILQNGVVHSPTLNDRLSVNATGSYGFSNNVNGNATLGFTQDRNQLTAITHRSIRVELSARFSL